MQEVLNSALQVIAKVQENSKRASTELKKIKMLFERNELSKLSVQVESNSLKNVLDALNLQELYNNLREEFKKYIEKYTASLRVEFDEKFLSTCQNLNLRDIKGNSMSEFRIQGILHIRIDFRKKIAELKTVARSKKINLDPIKVAHESKKEIDRLFGRPFDSKSFLMDLFKAYQKLQTESKKTVLLKDVHRIMWLEKQKDNFFETSDSAKMISYPLDEFSIDLSKLMESRVQTTNDGYTCKISLGSGGINIYRSDGNFNSYKFLEFAKGGNNV